MGCIPVIESFTDPRILGAVGVWMVIGCLLWTCLKGPITHDQRWANSQRTDQVQMYLNVLQLVDTTFCITCISMLTFERSVMCCQFVWPFLCQTNVLACWSRWHLCFLEHSCLVWEAVIKELSWEIKFLYSKVIWNRHTIPSNMLLYMLVSIYFWM